MLTTVSSYAEDRDNDEQIWNDLYTWLLSLVEKWVAYAHVTCWYGQQKEVSEDIAQEAILRVLRYRQRARRGEVQPIVSLKSLSKVIAQKTLIGHRGRCPMPAGWEDRGQDQHAEEQRWRKHRQPEGDAAQYETADLAPDSDARKHDARRPAFGDSNRYGLVQLPPS